MGLCAGVFPVLLWGGFFPSLCGANAHEDLVEAVVRIEVLRSMFRDFLCFCSWYIFVF